MCFVADSLTIVDIEPETEKFQKKVDKLSTSPLLGGWEEAFKEKFNEEENEFCGIKLWVKTRCRVEANLYVTDHRLFSAVRNESILAIKQFMDQRLKVNKNASKAFTSFTKFTANEDDIRDIHHSIAPDLSLANLAIQF